MLLTACGAGVGGAPDLVAPSGPAIYWDGQPAAPGVVDAVEALHPRAVSSCPPSRQKELEDRWRNLEIRWRPDPFDCRGGTAAPRMVHGCQPGPTQVLVSSVRVIPDEVGHIVWEVCYDRSGEKLGTDGKTRYDPDFEQWVNAAVPAIMPLATSP